MPSNPRPLCSQSTNSGAIGGSARPLPLVFLRDFATWGNTRKPRAATHCQPIVSQRPARGNGRFDVCPDGVGPSARSHDLDDRFPSLERTRRDRPPLARLVTRGVVPPRGRWRSRSRAAVARRARQHQDDPALHERARELAGRVDAPGAHATGHASRAPR
jgi:hypothetical protein